MVGRQSVELAGIAQYGPRWGAAFNASMLPWDRSRLVAAGDETRRGAERRVDATASRTAEPLLCARTARRRNRRCGRHRSLPPSANRPGPREDRTLSCTGYAVREQSSPGGRQFSHSRVVSLGPPVTGW